MARKLILAILIIAGLMMNINKEIKMANVQYTGGGGVLKPKYIPPTYRKSAAQVTVNPSADMNKFTGSVKNGTIIYTPKTFNSEGLKNTWLAVNDIIEPKKAPVVPQRQNPYSAYEILSNPVNMTVALYDFINNQVRNASANTWNKGVSKNQDLMKLYSGGLSRSQNAEALRWTGQYLDYLESLAEQTTDNDTSRRNYYGGYGGYSGSPSSYAYNPWNWFFSLLNWRI